MIANKLKDLSLLLLSILIVSCSEDAAQEEAISGVDLSDAYEVRRLTYDGTPKENLCFSPEGTKILFWTRDSQGFIGDCYIMNSKGSDRRLVPFGEWLDNYYYMWASNWTRDGSERVGTAGEIFYFQFIDARENGLYNVSREYKTDFDLSGEKYGAVISPNSGKVAFVLEYNEDNSYQSGGSQKDFYYDLCVLQNGKLIRFKFNEETKEGVSLGVNLEYISDPCFFSDGKKMVFSGKLEVDNDLFTLDLDSLQLTRLTFNKAKDHYPVISPDDRKIIFCSNRSGHDDIYMMDLTRPIGK